ncbi:MoaF C-terminal domain-containing protein [Devosia crocina]|uniref:MoaF C-terminal domain-containing protein n=1 Tax=Devosia crocina TaxID=429728 RepID=UPI000AC7DF73|nr:MoaF C-terminal domain-containing protein [Devosia crocina]
MSQIAENYKRVDTVTPDKLFPGHDALRPDATLTLVGQTLELHFEGRTPVSYTFDEKRVRWTSNPSANVAYPIGEAAYEAIEVGHGLLAATINHTESVSNDLMIVDLAQKRVLVVHSVMIGGTSTIAERSIILEAGIGAPLARPFPKTAELVGKRIHWSYGPTHFFEHIYIEPELYCWHGITGPEGGMGAVEPTSVRKIEDNLYLFTWSDRGTPFNGALVIDLTGKPRSAGRLVGWDPEKREISQIIVGATGTLVNTTDYSAAFQNK